MSRRPTECLVVGVGSRFRTDDAAGLITIEELARRELPPGVSLVEGGADDLGLVEHLRSCARVVVIDAARMGEPPGTVRVFFCASSKVASMRMWSGSKGLVMSRLISKVISNFS